MARYELPGEPPVSVSLRRTAAARRFSLRVSRLDGQVTLTMPARAREADALDFLHARGPWLRGVLAGLVPVEPVAIGTRLPVEGRERVVTAAPVRAATLEAERLLVPASGAAGPRVAALLKLLARQRLAAESEAFARRIGRGVARLSLRDTRSRWGSCSASGGLMYSWRLIMAPPEVLRYVAAHEVAHLRRMDHSPAFWDLVGQLMPDHAAHRAWLRRNGALLHRFDFGAAPPA
ncbi:M48 family metallopeptidase [Albidovulum sp.]